MLIYWLKLVWKWVITTFDSCLFQVQGLIYLFKIDLSFPNKNNHRIDLKCSPPLLIATLKNISFIFFSWWKNIRFETYSGRLLYKIIVFKNCVKSHLKINFVELPSYTQKRTISASIKTLQIKLLQLSAPK